ncbi:7401_t:CDS:2, partial [Acaulospora morrowiae]
TGTIRVALKCLNGSLNVSSKSLDEAIGYWALVELQNAIYITDLGLCKSIMEYCIMRFSKKADIYAFGIVVSVFLTGTPPFNNVHMITNWHPKFATGSSLKSKTTALCYLLIASTTSTPRNVNGNNNLWSQVVSDPKISPSVYAVAVGTWWSLSEDIFDVPYSNFSSLGVPNFDGYLFNYNLCTQMVGGKPKHNFMIGPNVVCLEDVPAPTCGSCSNCGSCWQNGIFGMEMSHCTAVEVATAAEKIYKGKTYWTVIKDTMNLAGFGPGSSVYNSVLRCFPNDKSVPAKDLSMECANLVKIWLVRNHLVGLSVAVSDNEACLKSSSKYPGYCMSDKRFSDGFPGVKNTINILARYFSNK